MSTDPIPLTDITEPMDRAQTTRRNLVIAGLKLFASQGFDATTTRQISEAADANVAAISYHFGSKDNLRIEVARSVAVLMRAAGPDAAVKRLGADAIEALSAQEAREAIRAQLRTVLDRSVLGPLSDDAQRFFHQELLQESPVVDVFYEGVMKHGHERMCRLVSRINGRPWDSEETRAAALMIFGQVMMFRFTRPIALRAMRWDDIGDREMSVLLANLWLT